MPAYITTIVMPDPSHVCDLHHSSQQPWILNSLREARDQIHNLMVPSWICVRCATMGTPAKKYFKLRHVHCYLDIVLLHLIDYRRVKYILFVQGKPKIRMTLLRFFFFTLLW